MKIIKYLLLVTVLYNLSSCLDAEIVNDAQPEQIRISSELTESLKDIKVGDEPIDLEATFLNNLGVFEEATVVWKSSNEQIAKIENDSQLIPVSVGDVVVTAAVFEGNIELVSQDFNVEIGEREKVVPEIIVTGSFATVVITGQVLKGQELELIANYFNEFGEQEEDIDLLWSSDNEAITKIDNNTTLTAIGIGKVIITVEALKEGVVLFTKTFALDVKEVIVPEININIDFTEIEEGEKKRLVAVFTDDEGIEQNVVVSYTVSNAIASINANEITGVSEGVVIVTASVIYEGLIYEDTVNITVTAKPVLPTTTKSGMFEGVSGYNTSGSFTITQVGNDIELVLGSDFNAASVPALELYIGNNSSSLAGATLIARGRSEIKSGNSFLIKDINVEDFSFLIQWCSAISETVGVGNIN